MPPSDSLGRRPTTRGATDVAGPRHSRALYHRSSGRLHNHVPLCDANACGIRDTLGNFVILRCARDARGCGKDHQGILRGADVHSRASWWEVSPERFIAPLRGRIAVTAGQASPFKMQCGGMYCAPPFQVGCAPCLCLHSCVLEYVSGAVRRAGVSSETA